MKTKKISKLVKKQRRKRRAANKQPKSYALPMWDDKRTIVDYFMGK